MGTTLGRQDPGGPHVGPMILAIWDVYAFQTAGHIQTTEYYFYIYPAPLDFLSTDFIFE